MASGLEQYGAAWDGRAGTDDSVSLVTAKLRTVAGRRTAELYQDLSGPLLRYLTTLVREPIEAEDLMQDAFLRLFHEFRAGRTVREPRAWLFKVAHHLAMDHHRKHRCSEYGEGPDGLASGQPDAEASLLASERDQKLSDALALLSPQQRQCLELRAEGLRYREIAEVVGVQISTVRTFIVRAVTRLARGLE